MKFAKPWRKWIAVPTVLVFGWGPLFLVDIPHWLGLKAQYSNDEAGFGNGGGVWSLE